MRIPDEKIEQVRSSSDIIDVIGGYVKLKKRGKSYVGLCPFHTEKTPSFTASAEKQMYHCFGCGKGGNVFTFLMEIDKLTFVESVRALAEKAGIPLPAENSRESGEESEFDRLYNATKLAGRIFHENLTQTDEGRGALEYFHGRGFTDATIRSFGLGYSLNSWDALITRLRSEGVDPVDIAKAGLGRKRDDGTLYDYFRGRAMFPILSTSARVIGFGARKIHDDDPIAGKYINSPETPIYDKSAVLFGLSHAREAIREEDTALMVEGYADLITLSQAGIQNVVASSGTALTREQLTLLRRYTQNLLLVYDADSAGSDAMVRGIDLALEEGMDVRLITLPEGEDPDSFVRTRGAAAFRELADASVTFIDFKARRLADDGYFTSPELKTKAIRSIVESIALIKDELKRNLFIQDVANKYGLYESTLHRELEKLLARGQREQWTPRRERTDESAGSDSNNQPKQTDSATIPAEERAILSVLLGGQPDVVHFVLSRVGLEDITDGRVRELVRIILEMMNERGSADVNAIVERLTDDSLKSLVTDVSVNRYDLSRRWKEMEKEIDEADPMKIASDAVAVFHRKALRRAIEENKAALREATVHGGDVSGLLRRQQELIGLLKSLESASSTDRKQA